jgi:hypothetical protein
MEYVTLVIPTRRPLGFEVGDVTYRVACGKLRPPKLDPV